MSIHGGISGGRFRSVDILRGLAALGVVIYHVRVHLWIGSREILTHPGDHGWLEKLFAAVMAPAFFFDSGVVLFFVISGFCVHWPAAVRLRSAGESGAGTAARPVRSWRGYFLRRLIRIHPPYVAALLLTVALESAAAALTGATPSSWPHVWHSFFMSQNYLPPRGQMSGNPALWSVPVEVELYLVYPLLLAASGKWGWRLTLGLAALVSIAASFAAANGCDVLQGNFLKFWAVWAAGAWLAEGVAGGRLRAFGPLQVAVMVAAGGLAIASAGTGIGRELSHLFYGTAFVLLLWWLTLREATGECEVETGPAKRAGRLGELSYSLYLIHFPLFFFLGDAWMRFRGGKPVSLLIPFLGVWLAVGLAMIFYKLVERPSHMLARKAARGFGSD